MTRYVKGNVMKRWMTVQSTRDGRTGVLLNSNKLWASVLFEGEQDVTTIPWGWLCVL